MVWCDTMPWLWSSWKEYLDVVRPTSADRPGLLAAAVRDSSFEALQRLFETVNEVNDALKSLHALGFKGDGHSRPPTNTAVISEAKSFVMHMIHCGEMLLLYESRLAKSDAAYGF